MSYFASVNGLQIVAGQLLIPAAGPWTADVQLATSGSVSGPCTVAIGNLTLQGTAYRSSTYGGQTRARIVAGAGGWRTEVTAQGYGNSSGVKLAHVLGDVAAACGESLGPVPDVTVGNAWARLAATASDVLWLMAGEGLIPAWYVDPDGTTQVASWPSTTVATPFIPTDHRPDEGVVIIATEDYASWMPGATFTHPLLTGSFTCAGVHYAWTGEGQFRFEVLTATQGAAAGEDRALGALQAVIAKQVMPTRFYGRYRYTIANPSSTTIDAMPVNATLGLPELQNVPLVSDAISTYTPPDGGDCRIMFADGDPRYPECVWTSGAPTMAQLLGGTNPVARLGDQVQSFLEPTLPLTGVMMVAGVPTSFVATCEIANPITGVITQGSAEVSSA